MTNVSAIVAAYNEEATVGDVVRTLKTSPFIGEVIVISDGSSDKTAQVARDAGADIVQESSKRMGKGNAVLKGVALAGASILFLSDADLIGLTKEHIAALIEPVVNGKKSMCIGLRDRGNVINAISSHLPLISGERVLHKSIFEHTPSRFLQGFMIEVALNYYCRSHRLLYGGMLLRGLTIRRKTQKVGFIRGLIQYGMMAAQIIRAMIMVRWAKLRGQF